jgi:hypothetical protein
MKLVSKLTQTINDYQLEINGKEYYYKEYLDDSGKVIDDELSDGDSLVIEDDNLLEQVRVFVDQNTSYYL